LKYDEVHSEIEGQLKVIKESIINPIKSKVIELNICNLDKIETLRNWYRMEILQLKENFSNDDLPEILSHRKKYIEYRLKTKAENFYFTAFFFEDLDEILKELFEFFNKSGQNEFAQIDFLRYHHFERKRIDTDQRYITRTELSAKDYFKEDLELNHNYDLFLEQIETYHKQKIGRFSVYTAELALFFTTELFPVKNMDTKEKTTINGMDYFNTFKEGYEEGEKFFDSKFRISSDTFYGIHADQYIENLHQNQFHIMHQYKDSAQVEGWGFVRKQYPFIITHKEVKKHGYFSGIVSKVEDLLQNHNVLFAKFEKCEHTLPPQQTEPKTFAELFYNPEHAEPCLKILNELQPPVIDAINNYIGKAKGVFPLWVRVLKNHKPEPLIKHFKDTVYKDLLNQKVNGLNLTKDASEFRKQYVRLENDKIELDIKTILSQYSQSGKLGK